MSAHHSPSRSPGPPAPAATPPTVSTATASTLIPVLPAAPPGCPPASSRSPRSANSTFSIRPAADVATTVRNDPRGRRRQRRPPRLARADPVSTKPNPLPRDLHGRPHPYALRVCGPSLTPLPQVATFRRIAPPRATGTAPAGRRELNGPTDSVSPSAGALDLLPGLQRDLNMTDNNASENLQDLTLDTGWRVGPRPAKGTGRNRWLLLRLLQSQ